MTKAEKITTAEEWTTVEKRTKVEQKKVTLSRVRSSSQVRNTTNKKTNVRSKQRTKTYNNTSALSCLRPNATRLDSNAISNISTTVPVICAANRGYCVISYCTRALYISHHQLSPVPILLLERDDLEKVKKNYFLYLLYARSKEVGNFVKPSS